MTMMICPDAARCDCECWHKTPHKKMRACNNPSQCAIAATDGLCVRVNPKKKVIK